MVRVHLMNNRYTDNSRPVALVFSPRDKLAPAGVRDDVRNEVINQMHSSRSERSYLFESTTVITRGKLWISVRKHGGWKCFFFFIKKIKIKTRYIK